MSSSRVAAILALASALARGAYDEGAALRYVRWTGASYCPAPELEAWTCKVCVPPTVPLTHVTYLVNTSSTITGVVGLSPSTNEVVVAFRGTTGTIEWLEDFDITKVPASLSVNTSGAFSCPGCMVSKGFSVDTYLTIRAQLLAAARATLAAAAPGARLVVTGHSLGGALAEVATFDLLASGLPVAAHVSFGTPRVGNAAWAAAWAAAAERAMPDAHHRVVHFQDLVPRLPPLIGLAFVHPPREVWYTESSASYRVCNATNGEDASCCDSDLPLGLADHNTYLNVSLGSGQC